MGAITIPGFIQAINWLTLVQSIASAGPTILIGPFRPPQWAQTQLYSLTVNQPVTTSSSHTFLGVGQFGSTSNVINAVPPASNIRQTTQQTTYFFDAVLRAEHRQELRRTEHPIQSGASIVDHCYLMPARVVLEIGMSDCMARFQAGQFTSNNSKSISAYQTLLSLQSQRVPLSLSTRLNSYDNMVIESISAIENYQTRFALRATVQFSQIILATTATETVSARPDQTDTTNEGTKQPIPPDSTTQNSNQILGFP